MTLINGRVVGINQREFSLRTGSDEESHGGGRLYEVDPAAVAHFKAVLAAQPPRKPQAISSQRQKQTGRLDADLQRKVNELAARARAKALAEIIETVETEEFDVTKNEVVELTETAVREAHGRFTKGESVKALAAEMGVPWQSLRAQFRRHGLAEGRQGAAKSAKTATTTVQTATAVALTTDEPVGSLQDQLAALQQVLTIAEAKSVAVNGRVKIELSAEVNF